MATLSGLHHGSQGGASSHLGSLAGPVIPPGMRCAASGLGYPRDGHRYRSAGLRLALAGLYRARY